MTKTKNVDPKNVVSSKVYAGTLKEINRIRKAAGLKTLKHIPPGQPGMSDACPIFNALKPCGVTSVGGSAVNYEVKSTVITRTIISRNPFEKKSKSVNETFTELDTIVDSAYIPIFGDFVNEFDAHAE